MNTMVTWIAEAQELKARSRNITVERVLEEYRRIAFAQTTDIVTLKGGWVQIADTDSLTTEQKSAISQIRQKKDGELEVRFYDKQKALDSLAKYLGIFSDKNGDATRWRTYRPEPRRAAADKHCVRRGAGGGYRGRRSSGTAGGRR